MPPPIGEQVVYCDYTWVRGRGTATYEISLLMKSATAWAKLFMLRGSLVESASLQSLCTPLCYKPLFLLATSLLRVEWDKMGYQG